MASTPEQQAPLPTPGAPSAPRPSRVRARSGNFSDRLFKAICTACALLIVVLIALLFVILLSQSTLALRVVNWEFITSKNWDPNTEPPSYGALAFIWGTLITSALSMLIAVPLGVGTAAFLSEIANGWIRRAVAFLIEILAAIPSVVYGFWGFMVLRPWVQDLFTFLGGPNTGGNGILLCSLILAVMIVPYVTAVSFDVCRAVPSSQRQAALALGATRWQMIWTAVLPYARPGIVAACFIALGRALGETMAATMLIGNQAIIEPTLWGQGDTIASKIALTLPAAADRLNRSALIELGLLLLLVTTLVNTVARLLIWRMGRTKKGPPLLARLFGFSKQHTNVESNGQAEPPPPAPAGRCPSPKGAKQIDRLMTWALGASVALTVGPLFFILGYLVYKGLNSLNLDFFTQLPTPPKVKGGGMANALVGSGMLVGLATLWAVPIGLFAAIYLAEYKNGKLAHAVRFVGELLGGVPSIVIGIFGYTLIVRPLSDMTSGDIGFCAWAGSFALGVMMLPIVMRASEEALKLVPRALRNASMALGANNWQTVVRITVPAALPAIVTAVFLAIARVAGETAPLLLTAGNDQMHWVMSPSAQTPSVPVFIYMYSSSPFEDQVQRAWAAALVLMVVVMLLNFGIRWITGKRVVLAARAD